MKIDYNCNDHIILIPVENSYQDNFNGLLIPERFENMGMVQENVVFGVEISFDEIDKCNNQFYKSYFKLPTKNLS